MIKYTLNKAKENIKNYVDERLPEEKCLVGVDAINREAWDIAHNSEDNREKIQALSLAKECYSMKLDLLTNASIVNHAVKIVEKHKHGNNNNNNNNNAGGASISIGIAKQSNTEEESEPKEQQPQTTNEVF